MTTDPLAPANLALTLLGKTTDALNALRERAQTLQRPRYQGPDRRAVRQRLGLKEVMSRLLDENKELRRQLATPPA